MNCPNCQEHELKLYDYEDFFDGQELRQRQWLGCPNCRYNCECIVQYKEINRQVKWEEKE